MANLKRVGNLYKNSTGSLTFNRETGYGRSYGWYEIAKELNGKRVLNTYTYSATTAKHASQLRNQFSFDIYLEAPYGLQNISRAIEHNKFLVDNLKATIARPRSLKRKNEERLEEIKRLEEILDFLKGCK